MSIDWKHSRFTGAADYVLRFNTSKAIGLDDGLGHQKQISTGWTHEVHSVGAWIADSKSYGPKGTLLKLFRKLPASDSLELNFEEGTLSKVTIMLQGESKECSSVEKLLFSPKESLIRIYSNNKLETPKRDVPPSNIPDIKTPTKTPTAVESQTDVKILEAALQRVKEQLAEANARLQEAEQTHAVALREINELRRTNTVLQTTVKEEVSKLFTTLRNDRTILSADLAQQMKKLDIEIQETQSIKKRIEEANDNIKKKKQEKAELNEKLLSLQSIAAIYDMDCEKIVEELESLKLQYSEDQNVAKLLSEDPALKNNSLTETMEQIKLKLDASEKRLELIIQSRERTENLIDVATGALGDGKVPLSEEQGGTDDGNGSGTEKPNP